MARTYFKKIALIKLILISIINWVICYDDIVHNQLENKINLKRDIKESLSDIIIDYFQYKGVKNVVIIECNNGSNKNSTKSQTLSDTITTRDNNNNYKIFSKQSSTFYRKIIKAGFYLNIFQLIFKNPEELKLSRAYKTGIILDTILDCTTNLSHEIFKIADKQNLFTTNNFWFLSVNDFNTIDFIFDEVFTTPDSDIKILIPKTNIMSMSSSLSSISVFDNNIRNDSLKGNVLHSNHSTINKNFTTEKKIYNNDNVVNVVDVNLENKTIEMEESTKWILIDVYRVAPFKSLKIQILSTNIQKSQDLIKILQNYGIFTAKRKNLEGIKILCGVVIEFPDAFTTFEDVKTRHINTISKVNYPLITNLRMDLNFSFNLMQMDNYGWNYSDGHFDGMMGQFQRGTIDFGVNALFMRLDRLSLCDFVAETFNIRACIIFRQPPLSAVENIFTLPFGLDVWISCFIFVIIATFFLIIQLWFHPIKIDMDFSESIIFVWGAICQQGFHVDFSTASGRYIVVTTFVSTLFLFTSFSANIVALLQSPSEAIKTVNDLAHSPLDAAAQDVKYNKIYFKEITDPETQNLYHKKIAPKGDKAFIRPHQGMEKVRKDLFAYQVESQAAYQIISDTYDEHEKCGLKELELFQLPVMSIPVKKKFAYKELFRQRLRWQRENGMMNREFRKWLPGKPKCENKVAGFVSIGLTESRYPLIYFASGLGITFFIFILEILWYKISKKFKKTNKNFNTK